jgi:phosphate transport system ATP-binding protein
MTEPFDSIPPAPRTTKMRCERLFVYVRSRAVLTQITLPIYANAVTALIGPTGSGKTSLLRAMNRMHDADPLFRVTGSVYLGDINIYDADIDVTALRRTVGMLFHAPTPFPGLDIRGNVLAGLRLSRESVRDPEEVIERVLGKVGLWSTVKDRLSTSPSRLTRGEQQRLCIARCLALDPEVLLLDDPCAQLDPVATTGMEELLHELKEEYALVVVTHNLQQAARVSDFTAFIHGGELIEFDNADVIFTRPTEARTEEYITGRFG